MKKEFNLEEIEIMPGDILVGKAVPDTKLILSDHVIEKIVGQNEFEIFKVGSGVNYFKEEDKHIEEEYIPTLKRGTLVYLTDLGNSAFIGIHQNKKYICSIIQSSSIKFILNKK
jgi:hypothetical protein